MNKQDIEQAIKYWEIFRDDIAEYKTKYPTDKYWDEQEKAVVTALAALEKQLNNGWIPVTERLPEKRRHESGELVEYIVMIKDAKVPTVLCLDDNGSWIDTDNDDYNEYNVLAWMPLPEPYREDEQK